MFKVTLKIKPNGEWVDGPTYVMDTETLNQFAQEHGYFKVEDATEEDIKTLRPWAKVLQIPTAFAELFK